MTTFFLSLLGLITIVVSQSQNCDKLGIRLYEDLGCRPKITNGSCPASYNCDLVSPPNKCLYQGRTYKDGEGFGKDKYGFSCHGGCFCNPTNKREPVICPIVECIENFIPVATSGCYYGFNLEQCCSAGEICPPINDTTTCIVDGTTYKAGQRFSPKNSCHSCVCAKGFDGKFVEPYCKRIGCDAQIRNPLQVEKFCAPVYLKEKLNNDKICCPHTWTCHDGTEIITRNNKESNKKCKYGQEEFNIGDGFTKTIENFSNSKNITCKCDIPPLMQCFD